jgi:hypothetical protein
MFLFELMSTKRIDLEEKEKEEEKKEELMNYILHNFTETSSCPLLSPPSQPLFFLLSA